MAKTKILNADLVWVFTEKLRLFKECAAPISIAIVQNKNGWLDSKPGGPHCPPSLRQAYRAGSEGASRDLRSG